MLHYYMKIYTRITVVMGLIFLYSLFRYGFFVGSVKFGLLLNRRFLVDIFPTFIGIGGLAVFAATKFQKSRLLKIFMCYNIFLFPFFLIRIQFLMDNASSDGSNLLRDWNFITMVLTNILLIVCSVVGLWLLEKRQKPAFTYHDIGDTAIAEFSPAPVSLRFVNRLADLLIIIYVLYSNIIDSYVLRQLFKSLLKNSGTGTFLLIEFLFTFYYYLILEGMFNTSIGKCITNTMIVDDTGTKPRFAQVIGRTFCRYIPFEPFSFFSRNGRGWHDSMSGTFVVKGEEEDWLTKTNGVADT